MVPSNCARQAVFSGSAPREASRVSLEGMPGVPRTGLGARSGNSPPLLHYLGLPSHAALSEAGEWSGVDPRRPETGHGRKNGGFLFSASVCGSLVLGKVQATAISVD